MAPIAVPPLLDMSLPRTIDVWFEALQLLENPRQQHMHRYAKMAVAEIRQEWLRRLYTTYSPEEIMYRRQPRAPAGEGPLRTVDWQKRGVLGSLRYKVGREGAPERVRHRILTEVFSGPRPPLFPRPYLDQWGDPGSLARLQKIADAIASFARNAKRRGAPGSKTSIQHWESDLRLHGKHYSDHFFFPWPSTEPKPHRLPEEM